MRATVRWYPREWIFHEHIRICGNRVRLLGSISHGNHRREEWLIYIYIYIYKYEKKKEEEKREMHRDHRRKTRTRRRKSEDIDSSLWITLALHFALHFGEIISCITDTFHARRWRAFWMTERTTAFSNACCAFPCAPGDRSPIRRVCESPDI